MKVRSAQLRAEEEDAEVDEGGEEGVPEEAEVVGVDGADLGHAALEEGVADGCGEHDGDEDAVLRWSKTVFYQNKKLLPTDVYGGQPGTLFASRA